MMEKEELQSSARHLSELVGEWVWICDNCRGWAKVTGFGYDEEEGFYFTWAQYDVGPDVTELWDDGTFTIDEIGERVLVGKDAEVAAHAFDNEMEEEAKHMMENTVSCSELY